MKGKKFAEVFASLVKQWQLHPYLKAQIGIIIRLRSRKD